MSNKKYVIQITRRHLPLITLINGGVEPHESVTKGKHWLTFEIEDDGKDSVNHEIVTERQVFRTHDIVGHCPVIMRIKPD